MSGTTRLLGSRGLAGLLIFIPGLLGMAGCPWINLPPVANAGPDRTVVAGSVVQLDGTGSHDPEDRPLTFAWTQTEGPDVVLIGANTARPEFTAPNDEVVLSFELVVSDGELEDADAVHVTVTVSPPQNQPPIADDQSVTTTKNTPVFIELVASDPDGDALTYRIVDPPVRGSLAGTAPNVTYTPQADHVGSVSFTFAANDGQVDSNAATVTVTITDDGDCVGATINSGETVSAAIDQASDQDSYKFCAKAGDRVRIVAAVTSGDFWPGVLLFPPGGGPEIASDYDPSAAAIDFQLHADGLYTIVVFDDWSGTRTGAYNLTFLNLSDSLTSPGDPDGGPVASGETVSGQINMASDMDAFTFLGGVNQRVRIVAGATSGDFWPGVLLFPPGGGPEIASDYDPSAATIDFQLLADGLYTIVVFDDWSGTRTGAYDLSLEQF
ncbi:MAG: cadherin-like domain-containing protein [Phycisphaerae bacterium]|nr:cadherin-like domain-containing protein [Phycisphaerae bacterium]